jgi:hypothetical protein
VAWALGLTEEAKRAQKVRLVTRNDGAKVALAEAALEEMAGDGVSVVIAGLDGASADRALAWCEAHDLPLLLLHPATTDPKRMGRVLGENHATELASLGRSLVAYEHPRALLVSNTDGERVLEVSALEAAQGMTMVGSVACDAPVPKAGASRYPFAQLRAEKRPSLVVSGNESCGRLVAQEITRYWTGDLWVGFALGSAPSKAVIDALPASVHALSLTAGTFDVAKADAPKDSDFASYVKQFGEPPSWWTALGRDAATLAAGAVTPLPLDGVSTNDQVAQRLALVAAGLRVVRAPLWTTEQEGFGESRTMARTLVVKDVRPKKK